MSNMLKYLLRKIVYSPYQGPEEYKSSATHIKAVGECPVKVVGISKKQLENILEISPELQKRLESIAGPRKKMVRLEKY